jgi:hypothetical protein
MTSHSDMVVVQRRFRGPPTSGNGGYVAGLVAEWIEGPAEVRLLAPIPLEVPLHRRRDEAQVTLGDEFTIFASGRPMSAPIDLDVPPPPVEAEIEAAAVEFPGPGGHPIPGCFVCGTERSPGDGLCSYAGESPGRDVAVAEWIPADDLAGDDGAVMARFVWAALDCPSYFALDAPRPLALLAQLEGRVKRPVMPGEQLRITAWALGRDGRKHRSATAIHDEAGELVALARALWFAVDTIPA